MYVFFFIKQKTAYEMRISDWSSDVCSSDLEQIAADDFAAPAGRAAIEAALRGFLGVLEIILEFRQIRGLFQIGQAFGRIAGNEPGLAAQIGRASCRERVCQYV